ncbi:MAG: hypothetical protein QMC81_07015 [Thermoanaerobacterales bacterium]|nr:hypothetical protein [Bacillota bacterium]MDI6907216.1 hypothetical protein [Thermoanaerobacterales bacterium]
MLAGWLALATFAAPASLYINSLVREWNKRYVFWQTRGAEAVEGEHFTVLHRGAPDDARLVLAAAEEFYPRVARDLGLEVPDRTPVLLYRDMEALNRSFGWSGNIGTMGVYWAGSIRVLAPETWIAGAEAAEREAVFTHSGPMAHEITHLFVDHLTRGNCPRWFNEGVAQYEEYRLTGFRFAEADAFDPARAFSLEDLGRFDALEDQDRAYHQAFSMVSFLVERNGWEAVRGVLADLGRGRGFDAALKDHTGCDQAALMGAWCEWLATGQE